MELFVELAERVGPLFTICLCAIVGLLTGKLFERFNLPHVSGQLLAGILLGPHLLRLFSEKSLHDIHQFSDLVLGLMTFTVGTHLNLRSIHNSWRRIVILAAAEVVCVFIAVTCAIHFLGHQNIHLAFLLGAISIATAPGTIISLMQKQKARGIMIKTLVGIVALNNVAAIVVFEMFKPAAVSYVMGKTSTFSIAEIIGALAPLTVSLLIGIVLGGAFSLLLRKSHQSHDLLGYGLILILLNLDICMSFDSLSPLLANLASGVVLSNRSHHTRRMLNAFDSLNEFLFAIFFVMAGTHLDLGLLAGAGAAGAIFVLARITAKNWAIFAASSLFKYPKKIRNYLGLALIPQAGLAVGLVISLGSVADMPGITREGTQALSILTTIVLAAVAINEFVGPFTTLKSFSLAGESGQANPRLVDFLHEEFILTHLKVKDKWDAIQQLGHFLHWSHHMHEVSEKEVIDSVLKREREMTTGLGEGIAIPHARMDLKKQGLIGVIGVLEAPIDFDAIDENPVNIIIMIVTPLDGVKLHLQVCQQVAKIFGHDPILNNRISNARDAAEVYDLLQSREVQEMNIFLDDE